MLPTSQANGLTGFPDAIKQALTVFGGNVTVTDGVASSTLSGGASAVGYAMAILIVIVAFTSGLTWIMGSDRTLAVSCYDGAGPRWLGKFSSRFGTPTRVNILSGVISTIVFVAATEITDGNAAKFFTVALALAISTTLISYIGIFPAAWVLRRQRPDDVRPYKAPLLGLMTIISLGFVLFSSVELLFPGIGDQWFAGSYLPDEWATSERWVYLLTEVVPLALFLAISVFFFSRGKAIRAESARSLSNPDVHVVDLVAAGQPVTRTEPAASAAAPTYPGQDVTTGR